MKDFMVEYYCGNLHKKTMYICELLCLMEEKSFLMKKYQKTIAFFSKM